MLVSPYKEDKKYQTFLKYNIDFLGYDSLNREDFNSLLKKRYLIAERPSWFFTDRLYENFRRLLSPPLHLRSQGVPYSYSDKQKLDNATSDYTASKLMMRDSSGRARVQSPSNSYDIANKTYVDSNFVKKNADTTMTAKLTAYSNTSYTTRSSDHGVMFPLRTP